MSVKELSNNILNSVNDISDLRNMTLNKLKNIKGVGEVKAIKILSSIELGRRVYQEKNFKKIKLNSADKVFICAIRLLAVVKFPVALAASTCPLSRIKSSFITSRRFCASCNVIFVLSIV